MLYLHIPKATSRQLESASGFHISWHPVSYTHLLLSKKLTGVDVKKIGGDQGYSGDDNRTFCKENGIETSFTRKGRTGKNGVKNATKRELARVRATAMEGSFGTQKEHYGLRKIAARIQNRQRSC